MPFSSLGPQAVQGDGSELRQGTVRVHDRRDEERDRAEGGRRRRQGVRQGRLLRSHHALRWPESVLEAFPSLLSLCDCCIEQSWKLSKLSLIMPFISIHDSFIPLIRRSVSQSLISQSVPSRLLLKLQLIIRQGMRKKAWSLVDQTFYPARSYFNRLFSSI